MRAFLAPIPSRPGEPADRISIFNFSLGTLKSLQAFSIASSTFFASISVLNYSFFDTSKIQLKKFMW
jgi:hypothetical protein